MNSSTLAPPLYSGANSAPGGPSRYRQILGLWIVIVVLALAYGIGSYGLIEPDEGRNAEVAREMAVSDCDGRKIFLLSTRGRDLGDAIEAAGVRFLDGNRRWMAFGPGCTPETGSPPGEQMEVD